MRIEFLSLPFDAVTGGAAVEQCLSWCSEPRKPHTVITANSAILCMMRRDAELRASCLAGDLIVADGMSVVWATRLAGVAVPERVTGVDLMDHLLRAGGERKLSTFFLGAKPEVVSRLAAICAESYPGLRVAGFRDGYFPASEHAAIAASIREAKPDMLFVGMPSPFKETWCEKYREELQVPVIMGVGGSFDVLAGYVKRAPRWVQSMGMEWSWRLAMEPRKMWRRYLSTNSEFLWIAAQEIVARRLGRKSSAAMAPGKGST